MITIVPQYYNKFACLAGRCRHSCCKGWEIRIDEDTLRRYEALPGAFGRRLCENIAKSEDGAAVFRLSADERCPFLNAGGLCDIYIECGEDMLCEICREHPRFRNYWSFCIEIGLGMACGECVRIILSEKEKMRLMPLSEASAAEYPAPCASPEEQDLFELREILFGILQDRSRPTDERIIEMLEYCGLDASQIRYEGGPGPEPACEQLAVYLIYRNYADALYDGRLAERIEFAARGYMTVRNEWASLDYDPEAMIEAARAFSQKYEYDTDTWNME